MTAGKVTFVGAGPGAPDLLTLRAVAAIGAADVVIWASSLVDPGVLVHARPGAEIVDSALLPLEGVLPYYQRASAEGLAIARVHSGDPALWGAVQEQLDRCRELGLATEIVPGVSSFTAVAASIGRELTIPEVGQSVILTRLGGGKTPMPPGEEVAELARHGTTMALFLSAATVRPAAGRTAGRRLSARHAVRGRLPGQLAGRADHALRAGRAGRHGEGAAGCGSTRWCWSGRRCRRAAPGRTSTTPVTSTSTGRPTGRPAGCCAAGKSGDRPGSAARARPAPDREGAAGRAADRLDHRDLRGRGSQGRGYCAGHPRGAGRRGDRAAVRPPGVIPGGVMPAQRRAMRRSPAPRAPESCGPRQWSSRTPGMTRT